jgi:AcrR family transcriptional regulator
LKSEKNTKEKILNAAIEVFEKKGYSGTRMQEIADTAGINKALLHYYFSSKEKLFYIIFEKALNIITPDIRNIFSRDDDIFKLIKEFVNSYIDTLTKYPYIPSFIAYELNTHPNEMIKFFKKAGIDLNIIKRIIDKNIKNGKIKQIEPQQLVINVISLCVFPFIGRPLINELVFNGKEEMFNKLMQKRKRDAANFIIDAIKK